MLFPSPPLLSSTLLLQPVSAILMARYLRSAIRRLDSARAEKMWLDDSVTSAW